MPTLPARRIATPGGAEDASTVAGRIVASSAPAPLPAGWAAVPAAMSARTVAQLLDMTDMDLDAFAAAAASAGLVARTVLGQPRYDRTDVLTVLGGQS